MKNHIHISLNSIYKTIHYLNYLRVLTYPFFKKNFPLKRVPKAIPGRESIDLVIVGM